MISKCGVINWEDSANFEKNNNMKPVSILSEQNIFDKTQGCTSTKPPIRLNLSTVWPFPIS